MIREMPFVLFVPVELGGVAHWIQCTLIVHTQQKELLKRLYQMVLPLE
jgi:hypothetical protein